MKPLTLEIHGTTALNRGSDLMTIAIAEQVRARFPTARVIVPPDYGGQSARAKHGFLTTWEMTEGVRTKNLLRFAPRPLKGVAGIVDPGEIDVVLDASDFSLSDDRKTDAAEKLLKKMNRRDRRHQTLLLMPQAFGPFQKPKVAKLAREVMDRAALIFVRDDASFTAVSALTERSKLRRFPDVAVEVSSAFPNDLDFPTHFSAIVPSVEVLQQSKRPEEYLQLLTYTADSLRRRNLNPVFILYHQTADHEVLDGLKDLPPDMPVWENRSPQELRAIVGRATLMVGSRYHALLDALIQGVPCIGAGWSHRFPELFRDFDSADLALPDATDIGTLENLLHQLSENEEREKRTQRIRQRANRIKSQSREMWDEIEAFINGQR
jgi:polysaccharide pyruvyl transferase WcaK-like protein